jgi:hypothetical protein
VPPALGHVGHFHHPSRTLSLHTKLDSHISHR